MELMTRDGNFTFLPSVITTAMPLLLGAPLQHKKTQGSANSSENKLSSQKPLLTRAEPENSGFFYQFPSVYYNFQTIQVFLMMYTIAECVNLFSFKTPKQCKVCLYVGPALVVSLLRSSLCLKSLHSVYATFTFSYNLRSNTKQSECASESHHCSSHSPAPCSIIKMQQQNLKIKKTI